MVILKFENSVMKSYTKVGTAAAYFSGNRLV